MTSGTKLAPNPRLILSAPERYFIKCCGLDHSGSEPYDMASPRTNTKPVEHDFVEEPSEEVFCPVTFGLLREPHQTLCCGNHLSQEAVSSLKGKPCPICTKPNFGTVPDKFFMRRVNELKLYCPNKSLGCEWVGELSRLDRHLNDAESGCQYPEVPVACEFSHAGCRAKLPRQLLQAHLSENVEGHLSRVAECLQHCQQQNDQQQQMIVKLQNTVTRQQQQIGQQQQQLGQQQRQIEHLVSALCRVHMTTSDIVVTDFKQHKRADDNWYSPPFYSHIGGYKMCLRVNANGYGDSTGTHVSVYVHLMGGEHDDWLQWPFCGNITVQLVDQKRDEKCWEAMVPFDRSNASAGRVAGRERAPTGVGFQKFIAHDQLSSKEDEFLKNDCLRFRIFKVSVN